VIEQIFSKTAGIGNERRNDQQRNEIVIEIEELEGKIAPSYSATFLD